MFDCPALWSAGPVLPHLAFCGGQVARVVAKAPQLRSLSLSRCVLVLVLVAGPEGLEALQ